eukprot:gene20010-25984_t
MSTNTPTTEKSRVNVIISGQSVGNALFRAEVKKELTFYRGCSATFKHSLGSGFAELTAEGKTIQLSKFIDWLKALELDLSQRKAVFTGPSIVIKLFKIEWSDYLGEIKGFTATEEAPQLSTGSKDEKQIEAKNMMGTDESV